MNEWKHSGIKEDGHGGHSESWTHKETGSVLQWKGKFWSLKVPGNNSTKSLFSKSLKEAKENALAYIETEYENNTCT